MPVVLECPTSLRTTVYDLLQMLPLLQRLDLRQDSSTTTTTATTTTGQPGGRPGQATAAVGTGVARAPPHPPLSGRARRRDAFRDQACAALRAERQVCADDGRIAVCESGTAATALSRREQVSFFKITVEETL